MDVTLDLKAPFALVARDRGELESAHAKMIEWANAKRDQVDLDIDVEQTNCDIAVTNGWLTAPFDRRLAVLQKQRVFYEKIAAAVAAGYAIVPNFAMEVFAIRTKAKKPRGERDTSHWNRREQHAQALAPGAGNYVSSLPAIYTETETVPDGKGGTKEERYYWAEEFKDVAFPIALAKPELMSRTAEAMAMKLFDEIGVAVDSSRSYRGDPIILGRLLNPRRQRPALTFFIGWYFDPSRL